MTTRRIGLLALGLVAAIVAVSPHAAGYVVPGPQAAALMIKALGSDGVLSVRQRVRFFGLELESPAQEVLESVLYVFPGRFRSEIRSPGIHRLHVEAGGRSVTVTDDRVTSRSVTPFDRYKDLMLYTQPDRLIERLASSGVNPQFTSLGRFGDGLAVIIGALYPDESRPQVWLDADSFLPLRWIVRPDDAPGGPFEIHFSAWQKVEKQWYPRRIECYENNLLVREITVEQVLTSASVQPGDFDVEALAARYAPAAAAETPAGLAPSDEIDKTIEDFRKRFESN